MNSIPPPRTQMCWAVRALELECCFYNLAVKAPFCTACMWVFSGAEYAHKTDPSGCNNFMRHYESMNFRFNNMKNLAELLPSWSFAAMVFWGILMFLLIETHSPSFLFSSLLYSAVVLFLVFYISLVWCFCAQFFSKVCPFFGECIDYSLL